MSNHNGGFLLCDVLEVLHRRHVFELLGKAKARRMVREITFLGLGEYDCNTYEILASCGAYLDICRRCVAVDDKLQDGLCRRCLRKQGSG